MAEESQAAPAFTQANEIERPVYELGFHIVPTVGEDGVSAVVERIRAVLGEAELINEGAPRKMTLSYQVERSVSGKREKYTEAYFGFIKFATEREQLPGIQEKLRNLPEVLRYLVIETVREDIATPRRAVFTSDRLEGKTIEKPVAAKETAVEVSEEELDKSLEALTE
jgi:ribosomal protein S6